MGEGEAYGEKRMQSPGMNRVIMSLKPRKYGRYWVNAKIHRAEAS